jgi:hypothetical protein
MFIDRKEIDGAGSFDHLDDDELSKTIDDCAPSALVAAVAPARSPAPLPQALRR